MAFDIATVNAIQADADTASGFLENIEWGRFIYPTAEGRNSYLKMGILVPLGSGFLQDFLEWADAQFYVFGLIPNEWYNREIDLSQQDYDSPQKLKSIADLLSNIEGNLREGVSCTEELDDSYICFSEAEIQSLIENVAVASATAALAATWDTWGPYWGRRELDNTDDVRVNPILGSIPLFGSIWISLATHAELRREYNQLLAIGTPITALDTFRLMGYDCKAESPPEQEDCQPIVDALEDIAENLENLDLPEFDYDRVIDAIKNHIDTKFPDVGGQHIGARCGATSELPGYSWKGTGFEGINDQIKAVQSQLNAIENRVCPEIVGTIPYSRACERGFAGSIPFVGWGLPGLSNQLDALGQQIDSIQQNLCIHSNTKGDNVRDSLTQLINSKFPQLSGLMRADDICGFGGTLATPYNASGFFAVEEMLQAMMASQNRLMEHLCLVLRDIDERLINVVQGEHQETKNRILENFPDLPGSFQGLRCEDDESEAQRYSWAGRGLLGVVDQISSVHRHLNQVEQRICGIPPHIDAKFPELPGSFEGLKCEDDEGEPQKYNWAGRGLLGLVDQNASIHRHLNQIEQRICDIPPDDFHIIHPVDEHDRIKLMSQLQLIWVKEGEKYKRGGTYWRQYIPNPKELDWCRDIAPLRWQRGGRAYGMAKWGSGFGGMTSGHFASEDAARTLMGQLIELSQDTNIQPRISTGVNLKKPREEITAQVVRASVLFYDEEQELVGKRCLKPPREGC
ncbi:MAG: hypothetical protein AAGG51_23020 [Cyanobacteria bacterium P01_G01_bin.54]